MSITNPVTHTYAQQGGDIWLNLTWSDVTDGTPTEGSLLVVLIQHSSPIGTVPTGWALSVNNGELSMYWKIAVAVEADAVWEMTVNNQAVLVYGEFISTTGWDSTPVDVTSTGTATTSTLSQPSGTTQTTAQDEALGVAGFGLSGGANAATVAFSNSYTLVDNGVSQTGAAWSDEAFMASKVLSATGTQSSTMSWASPSKSSARGVITVFLPVASGPQTSGTIGGGGGITATAVQGDARTVRAFPTILEAMLGPAMSGGGSITASGSVPATGSVAGGVSGGGGIVGFVSKGASTLGSVLGGGSIAASLYNPVDTYTFVPPVRVAGGSGFEPPKVSGGRIPHQLWKYYADRLTVGYSVFITDGVGTPYPGRMVPSADQIRAADVGSGEGGRAWFRGGLTYTVTAAERAALVAAGYAAHIT